MDTHLNFEIKVRVPDLNAIGQRIEMLGTRPGEVFNDLDTYFRVPNGRLKLRQTMGESHGTLISYHRSDRAASRYSDYQLLSTDAPDQLRAILAHSIEILTTVAKVRQVFTYGQTRIHLDEVAGLGSFVELETVLAGQTEEEAQAEHEFVKHTLGLDRFTPVPGSYSDLMLDQSPA